MLAVLLASCSEDMDGGGPPPQPDPRLRGSVLALVQFQSRVEVVDLPSGVRARLPVPGSAGDVITAFWDGDGASLYMLVREVRGGGRLYRTTRDGEAEPVGPETEVPDAADHAGRTLMASVCDERARVLTLDLDQPDRWREIGEGCGGALSPDGSRVASTSDFRSVWVAPADGSRQPRLVFDPSMAQNLSPTDRLDAGLVSQIDWGPQGIAVVVGVREHLTAVFVDPDAPQGSRIRTMEVGDTGPRNFAEIAWQPGGNLLALGTGSRVEGILRFLDPDAGETRVTGLDSEFFVSPVWSPDGRALVTSGDAAWVFLGDEGSWLRRAAAGQSYPVDWAV